MASPAYEAACLKFDEAAAAFAVARDKYRAGTGNGNFDADTDEFVAARVAFDEAHAAFDLAFADEQERDPAADPRKVTS